MEKNTYIFSRFIAILILGLLTVSIFPAQAQVSSINLTGKVTAVNVSTNSFSAQVITATSGGSVVSTLPSGTSVQVNVRTGTTFNSSQKPLPLSQVKAGMAFAATGLLASSQPPVFNASSVIFTTNVVPKVTLDPACMKGEAKKRDDTILGAWDTYTGAIKSAIQNRSGREQAAWDITDKNKRNTEFKALIKEYRTAVQTAKKTMAQARGNAWKTYKTGIKACNATPAPDTNSGVDEQL